MAGPRDVSNGQEGDDGTGGGGRQDERRDLGFGEKSEATWAMGAGSLSLGAAGLSWAREQGGFGGSELAEGLTLGSGEPVSLVLPLPMRPLSVCTCAR